MWLKNINKCEKDKLVFNKISMLEKYTCTISQLTKISFIYLRGNSQKQVKAFDVAKTLVLISKKECKNIPKIGKRSKMVCQIYISCKVFKNIGSL